MTNETDDKQPKWRRRADQRPDEVMDAALSLFIEKGFAATRVEDIARRANLSKGAVYLYFDSKEAILKALVRRAIVPIVDNGEALAAHSPSDPEQAIRTTIRHIAGNLSNPKVAALPRLIIAESGNFPEIAAMYREEVLDRGLALMEQLVRHGVERGVFRQVEPRLAVRNIIGPVLAQMLLSSVFKIGETGPDAADKFVDSHMDILFNGLLVDRHPGGRDG